ncbi:MAG: TIM barrel protein [Proteobacteria bacterium]|nr:TIM barrel protein [Pseudomonadota bacterium]
MNLACSTLPFRNYPLSEALRKIASFGMKRVELCVDPLHSNIARWKERPEEMRLLIEDSGLVLNSIHVPLPEEIPDYPYEGIKENWSRNTKTSIDLAAFLGAPFVVQHVMVPEIPRGPGNEARKALPDLLEIARYGATHKIKVAVENAPSSTERMLGADVRELMEVVGALPEETVGICLDLSHCLACGYDPVEALESVNVNRLLSIHASDNRSNELKDIHLPLGVGDIPWRRVLNTLEFLGFRGSFVIEVGAEREDGGRALTDSLSFLREVHRFDDWP